MGILDFERAAQPSVRASLRPTLTADIIIVSKTRMGEGKVCVGALDVTNNRNIRLLTEAAQQQPENTEFAVGKTYRATYRRRPNCVSPHTEDVLLGSFARVDDVKIRDRFKALAIVVEGPISNTFAGCLSSEASSSYSVRQTNIPDHSVCFWRADSDLTLDAQYHQRYGKFRYLYGYDRRVAIPYVGTAEPIPQITQSTVVRLSLARWWRPSDATYPDKRCQLQISGSY